MRHMKRIKTAPSTIETTLQKQEKRPKIMDKTTPQQKKKDPKNKKNLLKQ
jgi:hypothetical protein